MYSRAFSLSRLFILVFCDMALVGAALSFLVRTEGFSRRGPALAIGVVMGLGLLCRAFFPVFLIGPLGVNTYAAWRECKLGAGARGTERLRWQVNGRLALLVCAAVAAPWYLIN